MYGTALAGLPPLAAHLLVVGASVMLLVVWLAIGARVRRLVAREWPAPAWVRWPVDAALGLGIMGTAFLALGAVRLLHPVAVLAATLAGALVTRHEMLGVISEAAAGIRSQWRTPAARAAAAVALLFAVVLLAGAVAPPTEWDSLMYHLRIPLGFLGSGRVSVPADSFHVALIGVAHLATLPLLAAGLVTGPAVMQVFLLLLVVTGTAGLARTAGESPGSARLAGLIVLGGPALVLVAITARVDVALVAVLVAAHVTLLDARARPAGSERGPVMLAAVLVGVAFAIKPQAGAYALALVPLGWRAAGSWRVALAAAACAAVVAAPWYLKNFLLAGAPLYPVGEPGWLEPWLAEIFGGRVPPPGFDNSILRALPESRERFDLWAAFTAPERLTIELEGRHYGLSPAFLVAPLALLRWRTHRAVAALAAVALAYCALIIVPFGQINLRYLLPAFPALAVAAASLASGAVRTWIPASARRVAIALVVVGACWPLAGALRARFGGGESVLLRHAVGLASPGEVWLRHPDVTVRTFGSVPAEVQRLVRLDGRVLLLWEARALPLRRETLADLKLTNWSYLAQSPAYRDCLAGTGITHVLVNSGALRYYLGRGADPRAFYLDRFRDFGERCLGPATVVGPGFDLYEVVAPDR